MIYLKKKKKLAAKLAVTQQILMIKKKWHTKALGMS